jgi:transcriptional regulator with XRE-family HTH domain
MKNATKAPPAVTAADSHSPIVPDGPRLGDSLRKLRFDRRMSLTEVGVATGIAQSTLSRVERNQLSLTYDKLVQLCRGLNVDLATLLSFGSSADGDRQLGRRTFTPPGGGREVTVNLQDYVYLCTELAGKKMTPMICVVEARTLEESNGLTKHDGEEFAYVLEGTLKLCTELYEPLVLPAGSSVYFDSTMWHAYLSAGSEPARVMVVCTGSEPVVTRTATARPAANRAAPNSAKPKRRRTARRS